MRGYIPNHFLSELIDISDKYSTYQYEDKDKDLLASINKLRQIVNKAPIVPRTQQVQVQHEHHHHDHHHHEHHEHHEHHHHQHEQVQQVSAPSVTEYFSANLTVNPPTSSNSGFQYSFDGARFNANHWEFAVGVPLTVHYTQSAFADAFAPVAFRITGDPATFLDDVKVSVNDMVVLNRSRVKQNASSTPGIYEFYIPATCFKQGHNKIQFTVVAGVNLIRLRGVSVVSAPGFSDVKDSIRELDAVFAKIGSLNIHIINRWPHILDILRSHSQLASLVTQGEALQKTMADNIVPGLRQTAINLRIVINSFIEYYLPAFIDPTYTKEEKLLTVGVLKRMVNDSMPSGIQSIKDFHQYHEAVRNFRKQVQQAATSAFGDIKAALDEIDRKVQEQENELQKIRREMIAADIGLVVFNIAAAIGEWAAGAFLGPYGPIVELGINILSSMVSAFHQAFILSLEIRINNCYYEIAALNKERSEVLAKQKEIEQMLGHVTQVSEDVDTASSYSQAFADLWDHIKKQFDLIEEELHKMPGNTSPAFDTMSAHFTTQLKPYFRGAITVLEGYIFSF